MVIVRSSAWVWCGGPLPRHRRSTARDRRAVKVSPVRGARSAGRRPDLAGAAPRANTLATRGQGAASRRAPVKARSANAAGDGGSARVLRLDPDARSRPRGAPGSPSPVRRDGGTAVSSPAPAPLVPCSSARIISAPAAGGRIDLLEPRSRPVQRRQPTRAVDACAATKAIVPTGSTDDLD